MRIRFFVGENVIEQHNVIIPIAAGTEWRLVLRLDGELENDVLSCQPAVDRREGIKLVLE